MINIPIFDNWELKFLKITHTRIIGSWQFNHYNLDAGAK
jgi:hypothetical protein